MRAWPLGTKALLKRLEVVLSWATTPPTSSVSPLDDGAILAEAPVSSLLPPVPLGLQDGSTQGLLPHPPGAPRHPLQVYPRCVSPAQHGMSPYSFFHLLRTHTIHKDDESSPKSAPEHKIHNVGASAVLHILSQFLPCKAAK